MKAFQFAIFFIVLAVVAAKNLRDAPSFKSSVDCNVANPSVLGHTYTCTITVKDVDGDSTKGSPSDFAITARKGQVAWISTDASETLRFSYTAPDESILKAPKLEDQILVEIKSQADSPKKPTRHIHNSPVPVYLTGTPSVYSELTCTAFSVVKGNALKCQVAFKNANGNPTPAFGRDLFVYVQDMQGKVLEQINLKKKDESRTLFTFSYTPSVIAKFQIVATLRSNNKAIVGSPLTINTVSDRLVSNGDSVLSNGEKIYSPDLKYYLVMQDDCNLVIYNSAGKATWDADSDRKIGGSHCTATLKNNGKMVVTTLLGVNRWDSDSDFTNTGVTWQAILGTDGNLVIQDNNGVAVWSSNKGLYLPSTATKIDCADATVNTANKRQTTCTVTPAGARYVKPSAFDIDVSAGKMSDLSPALITPASQQQSFTFTLTLPLGASGTVKVTGKVNGAAIADSASVFYFTDRIESADKNILSNGQYIISPDGKNKMIMQGDCNLVIYTAAGKYLWDTKTDKKKGGSDCYAIIRNSGEFAVVDEGRNEWDTNSDFTTASSWVALLGNDGVLYVQDTNGVQVWSSAKGLFKPTTASKIDCADNSVNTANQKQTTCTVTPAGDAKYIKASVFDIDISAGKMSDLSPALITPSTRQQAFTFTLTLPNGVGSVKVTGKVSGNTIASTETVNYYTDRLESAEKSILYNGQYIVSADGKSKMVMQGDCNLVIYTAAGKYLWDTKTDKKKGGSDCYAIIRNSGEFAVVDEGRNEWDTNSDFTTASSWVALLGNDGVLYVQDTNGVQVWSSAKGLYAPSAATQINCADSTLYTANKKQTTCTITPAGAKYIKASILDIDISAGKQTDITPALITPTTQQVFTFVVTAPAGTGNIKVTGKSNGNAITDSASIYYYTDRLESNEFGTLYNTQYLISADGKSKLYMQDDCNFVVYSNSKATWSSDTDMKSGGNKCIATMQGDGNLVIYKDGSAQWASGTDKPDHGAPYTLVLGNDGVLNIQAADGFNVWFSTNNDRLVSSGRNALRWGEMLMSNNKKYRLYMQHDRNLVLYNMKTGKALWSSGTSQRNSDDNVSVLMQSDGNLVVYSSGKALWASGSTKGSDTYAAVVQDDGNFVIYKSGKAVWASNTSGQLVKSESKEHHSKEEEKKSHKKHKKSVSHH